MTGKAFEIFINKMNEKDTDPQGCGSPNKVVTYGQAFPLGWAGRAGRQAGQARAPTYPVPPRGFPLRGLPTGLPGPCGLSVSD